MHVLDAVLEEAEQHPDGVARLTWLEDLLTDGYGAALSLEAEARRIGREIDDALDMGGSDLQPRVAALARRLRHLENDARQLRERLDEVWALTRTRVEHPDTVPPDA